MSRCIDGNQTCIRNIKKFVGILFYYINLFIYLFYISYIYWESLILIFDEFQFIQEAGWWNSIYKGWGERESESCNHMWNGCDGR